MDVKKNNLANLRSKEKMVLQLVRNALEEARNDFKEIGRPLTFRVHDGSHDSLLTSAFESGNSKQIELSGVVNLLIMLLLITNVKNVLISLQDNGFTLR
jgi:hypothetical protein